MQTQVLQLQAVIVSQDPFQLAVLKQHHVRTALLLHFVFITHCACTPCPSGTASNSLGMPVCIPCASGFIASSGSTSCQALEHEKIILTLTGSIDTFGEGSERRKAFISALSSVLAIVENQMVIISVRVVTAGSVIVDLGFLRINGAQSSPTEVVSRLKLAATSGQLDKFGLTALSVGQENVFDTNSASVNVGTIVGASVGGVVGIVLLGALFWKLCGNVARRQIIPFSFFPFRPVRVTPMFQDVVFQAPASGSSSVIEMNKLLELPTSFQTQTLRFKRDRLVKTANVLGRARMLL